MWKKIILNRKFNEYSGAIHNHTSYSKDGRIPLREIVNYALDAKLDFITTNDHNDLACLQDEAYVKNKTSLLIIVGVEVNDPDDNHHLLVFNTNKVITECDPSIYVNTYTSEKAICFAAHPNERRITAEFRKYEWIDRSLNKFDGIEIWNYGSSWLGKVNPIFNGILCVFFPELFVRKPLRKNLNFWDDLNLANLRKSAIASTDAHDVIKKKGPFTFRILSYKRLFRTLRTNVLLPENVPFTEDNVLNALRKGHSYICNYAMGKPWTFYAAMDSGEGKSAIFGEEIILSTGMKFHFNLPLICDVHLYHNGKKIDSKHEKNGCFKINEPGFYRLEISRYRYGWIYTNPIYVLPYK